MGALSPTHWLVLLVVVLLLFGTKKLPDLARSIGRSTRIVKSEVRELREDRDDDRADTAAPAIVEPGRPATPRDRVETPPAAGAA